MKTASFPRTRVLFCATALLTAPVLVAEEAAGLLAVDLRVTSPVGTEVPISTATNSPVAIYVDAGAGVTFMVASAQGEMSIKVIEAGNSDTIIDSGRVRSGDSVTLHGYRFEVADVRPITSAQEIADALTP